MDCARGWVWLVMSEDDYLSENITEKSAASMKTCPSFMDRIIAQDAERLEQYPKVITTRRVIARVQIEPD
jgi:hypothetical protein